MSAHKTARAAPFCEIYEFAMHRLAGLLCARTTPVPTDNVFTSRSTYGFCQGDRGENAEAQGKASMELTAARLAHESMLAGVRLNAPSAATSTR
jgi:hypothetical protein